MTASEAAKRLLSLAGKATKGPWVSTVGSVLSDRSQVCGMPMTDWGVRDSWFISETRTLAPKIAEALLVCLEHTNILKDQVMELEQQVEDLEIENAALKDDIKKLRERIEELEH